MVHRYSCLLMNMYGKGIAVSSIYSPYMMWKLAKHKDSFVRSDLAKALVYDTKSSVALDILCKLSKDKDSLVRVEAVDSLSEYFCEKSYKALKNALYDPDDLVRKYALFGIAYTGRKLCPETTIDVLCKHREKEMNLHCKLSIYEGLYILGQEEYLEKLMKLFWTNDYQIQCSVVNDLSEVADKENASRIREFLETLNIEDHPVAVQSSMKKLEGVVKQMMLGR